VSDGERAWPPKKLGRFEIGDLLGFGGMAQVYKARDTDNGQIVAIKIPVPDEHEDSKHRFWREAANILKIEHPNIVRALEVGLIEGVPFLVMELLVGEDLDQFIKDGRRPNLSDLLNIAIEISGALNYVHTKGVIHRDLKPSNVFICSTGIAKLIDFGIAKPKGWNLTTRAILGSPAYMSPEQAQGKDATPAFDVYGFGALMFTALTGRRPFTGNDLQILDAVRSVTFPLNLLEGMGLPRRLIELIGRCTQKDPAARPDNFREIQEELEAVRSELLGLPAVLPSTVTAPPVEPPRAPKPVRTQPTPNYLLRILLAASAVAIVGIIVFFAYAHLRPVDQASVPLAPLQFIEIAAGSFMMGCSDGDELCHSDETDAQGRARKTTITADFWITATEIPAGHFRNYAEESSLDMPPEPAYNRGWQDSALPVVNTTWHEAREYCRVLGGDLPTEAQWEHAARAGGTARIFPWGNGSATGHARYNATSAGRVYEHRQGTIGLYGVVGNAAEWVLDWYDPRYLATTSGADPTGPSKGSGKVVRGGSFLDDEISNLRISDREYLDPDERRADVGFRCARFSAP
jgi:formylglycine-generating enzyme required for sulfatase activity